MVILHSYVIHGMFSFREVMLPGDFQCFFFRGIGIMEIFECAENGIHKGNCKAFNASFMAFKAKNIKHLQPIFATKNVI